MNVQDLIAKELMEEESNVKPQNEMLEILEFMKVNGVPLTEHQAQGIFLLNEFGLSDIAMYANAMRPELTPTKKYFDMVNKITMADRIKGTAKLDKILKAQVSSPNNAMPNPPNESQVNGKVMRARELDRI